MKFIKPFIPLTNPESNVKEFTIGKQAFELVLHGPRW